MMWIFDRKDCRHEQYYVSITKCIRERYHAEEASKIKPSTATWSELSLLCACAELPTSETLGLEPNVPCGCVYPYTSPCYRKGNGAELRTCRA
jgi:hypothetical protein